MALRRKEKRTERSKLDATPPWETRRPHLSAATTGPYDVADAPSDGVERLDLGALQIPANAGLEIRVEVGEDSQVAGITLVNLTGQMQLGVFAAPRNDGIWGEVRAEIKASISSQGGTVSEQDGEFGGELIGKLPAAGGYTPVRFVGVDGPRWFLRGMLAGGPADSDSEAEPFLRTFRQLIVVRGNDPLPVREPVPLRLPAQAADQLAQAAAEQEAAEQASSEQGPSEQGPSEQGPAEQ